MLYCCKMKQYLLLTQTLTYFFLIYLQNPQQASTNCVRQHSGSSIFSWMQCSRLINKYISGPLWRKLESKISITEMSRAYQDTYNKLKEWANDSSDLLTGNDLLFTEIPLKGDVLTELLSPSPYDDLATECLQIMFKSFVSLMERLLQDHLDGGKFSESSSELSENTRSVPCTNTISERDFPQLDRFLRMKPNATTLALEGVILYANNKTSQWLSEKSREEREKIISAAKRIAPKHKALFKE